MVDFLADLLASILGGLVPERVSTFIVGLLMLVACIAFAAMGAFVIYQLAMGRAEPVVAVGALVFFGLSGFCGRLALKGLRSSADRTER